jgi:hypothetical protein
MQRDDMKIYELKEDLNNLSDDDLDPHLTRQDYEKSLELELLFNNEESINNMGESTYQGLIDSIVIKLQHKYILMPRKKNPTNFPPKNIFSRGIESEEVVTKPLVETQVSRRKTVETRKT